jgi:AcrR family transcriptional regulator
LSYCRGAQKVYAQGPLYCISFHPAWLLHCAGFLGRLPESFSGCKFFGMAAKRPLPAQRKPRADAERNRERVLEVAKEVFTRSGADASLDDIAKQAGVGAGTLYRHFPSREALIEAVYRTEVEKLAAAERNFAETMTPIEALRAWMLLFVDYIATKKIIAPALNTLVGATRRCSKLLTVRSGTRFAPW